MRRRGAAALLVVATLAALAACGQDSIAIAPATTSDYNRGKLIGAIDRFVAAGRTAPAFAALVDEVLRLREGMDETVAEEAERKLTVLALTPVENARELSTAEQVQVLGTTVWPFALGPALASRTPDGTYDPRGEEFRVHPGETVELFLLRLCGGVLALECKSATPEYHGALVGAMAVQRFTERARNAISSCLICASDPAWRTAVARWEKIDSSVSSRALIDRRRAQPSNWPVAGPGAQPWGGGPIIEIEEDGDTLVEGKRVDGADRVRTLAELGKLQGPEAQIGVFVPPNTTWTTLEPMLIDAARAHLGRVVLLAREPAYPWLLRTYPLEPALKPARRARVADSVQVVLRELDEHSRPPAKAAAQ